MSAMHFVARTMDTLNGVIAAMPGAPGCLEYYRDGVLVRQPFSAMYRDVLCCGAFLRERGVQAHAYVGFAGANCYEWLVADLACLMLGAVSVPFDPFARHEPAQLIGDYALTLMLSNVPAHLASGHPLVHHFEAACADAGVAPACTPYRFAPHDVLSVKFTSGSTQAVKAVKASAASADDSIASVQELFGHGRADKLMVFLPLYLLQQRYWLYSAILYGCDFLLTSYQFVLPVMRARAPTVIMGVPEFFETVKQRFFQDIEDNPDLRSAFEAYREENRARGAELELGQGFAPFQRMLGGAVRYLWSGSAASARETVMFYAEMGVPIFQGYGMTEICIFSKNYFGNNKIGSAGKLLPNKEVRFDSDGQILARNYYPVSERYFRSSEEENAATFTADGLVATGDLGHLDADGYLFITGRKKDLIVLSSGRKVEPARIERQFLASPLIRDFLLHGAERAYLVGLVHAAEGVTQSQVDAELEAINARLPQENRVFGFARIDHGFTAENGLRTSQLKLRRSHIARQFAPQIEALYS